VQIRAGQLDDVDVQGLAEVDGGLIEGRRHTQAIVLPDRLDEDRVPFRRQARVHRLLDVPDIRTILEILVNEVGDVPELELDGGLHAVVSRDLREVLDDLETALEFPEVVVGELENEELVENVVVHQGLLRIPPGPASSLRGDMIPGCSGARREGRWIGTD